MPFTAYVVLNTHDPEDRILGIHVYDGEPNENLTPQDFGYKGLHLVIRALPTSPPSIEPEALKVQSILQHSDAWNGAQLRRAVERLVKDEQAEKGVIQGEVGARIFAVNASLLHAETSKATIKGLTFDGKDMGDWQVEATCTRTPERPPQEDDGTKITKLTLTKEKDQPPTAEITTEPT